MTTTEVYDEAFFRGVQDRFLGEAKRQLLETGGIQPVVLVLASPVLTDPELMSHFKPLEEDDSPVTADTVAAIYAPGCYNTDLAFEFICRTTLTEQGRENLETLMALTESEGLTRGQQKKSFCRAFHQHTGLGEKDVYAMWLKDFLKRAKAHAYLKVDDTWAMTAPSESRIPGESLEDNPAAGEAIVVMMETKQFIRAVQLHYERTERGTGKVTSFGETVEFLQTGFEGRFTNLLAKDADLPAKERA